MAASHSILAVIDPEARVGYCVTCGMTRLKSKGRRRSGETRWGCAEAARQRDRRRTRPHREYVGGSCERCGFVPEHPCQLDVHHLDHNRRNNAPSNLKTLCANCHRLEHRKEDQRLPR